MVLNFNIKPTFTMIKLILIIKFNLKGKIMKKIFFSLALASCVFVASANAKAYEVDKTHTNIGFKIRHLGISTVNGDFKEYGGSIDFDPKSFVFNSFEGYTKVSSINTENKSRDSHLQEDDFFKAKKYPELTFKMKKYQKKNNKKGTMIGDLSIAGVTKEVKFDTEIGGVTEYKGKEKIGFSLRGSIKRSDFNFASGANTLGDEVEIIIDMEADAK